MLYENMTDREQRLSRSALCPLCHQPISKVEDVQILKLRYGKRILPFYFHSSCLLNSICMTSQLEEVEYGTCETE